MEEIEISNMSELKILSTAKFSELGVLKSKRYLKWKNLEN